MNSTTINNTINSTLINGSGLLDFSRGFIHDTYYLYHGYIFAVVRCKQHI